MYSSVVLEAPYSIHYRRISQESRLCIASSDIHCGNMTHLNVPKETTNAVKLKVQKHFTTDVMGNGPFLTVNQSMFTEIEVANQWYCRTLYNLCTTLHKRTCVFCL